MASASRTRLLAVKSFDVDYVEHLAKTRRKIRNVIAILQGSDTALANEAVVIGAHYDHLGLGGRHSLSPELAVYPPPNGQPMGFTAGEADQFLQKGGWKFPGLRGRRASPRDFFGLLDCETSSRFYLGILISWQRGSGQSGSMTSI